MGALTDPVHLAAKAAVAASAAMLATQLLHVSDSLSAGFVAVICVSPMAYAGLRRGLEQLLGSLLGSAVTWGLLRVPGLASFQPLVVLLAVLVSVRLCFALRLAGGYTVASFSAMYVAAMPFSSATVAVETRLFALGLGIAAATTANLVVSHLFGVRILDRRMRLTRAHVAQLLARLPDLDTSTPLNEAVDAIFEPVFAVVAELHADLGSATHDIVGRGATGQLAEEHLAEAIRLRTLLHLAKTLVLLRRPLGALAPALAALQQGESLSGPAVDEARQSLRPSS